MLVWMNGEGMNEERSEGVKNACLDSIKGKE